LPDREPLPVEAQLRLPAALDRPDVGVDLEGGALDLEPSGDRASPLEARAGEAAARGLEAPDVDVDGLGALHRRVLEADLTPVDDELLERDAPLARRLRHLGLGSGLGEKTLQIDPAVGEALDVDPRVHEVDLA